MDDRTIFHIDVNSAFLSWEAVHRLRDLGETLDLRTIPSAVGGDMSKRHGVILAKSIPAKKYNVRTGEPIVDALRKCPNLTLVSPDRELYSTNSAAFMEILRRYSDVVEQYSIDEAFVDMTGTRALFGSPMEAAYRLKDEIRDTLGFTVNVGISSNKLLAKMAGEFEKPDKVHTLFPYEIQEKMWPLPVGELFSVGGASEQKLRRLGINTIGDLARADLGTLRAALKKHGEAIWNFANGRDLSLVEAESADNKGYGNSTTLAFDVTDADTAKMILLSLAETVGRRLRRDGAWIETVSVALRFFDLSRASHQCVLDYATNITDEIYQAACRLFDEFWDGTPIRLIGIQTGKVTKDGDNRQMSLFDDTDYEKLERLDKAMDSIREKFGENAVRRASLTSL
ncbi:Y-family DNA polymerase [Acetatifactor aquisgranensis]|uniref:Y-family DNA polymerase n=1 Tax=Acetatifactor aquisgranensis TaxID=2941233 RepID=UPI00203AFC9D|nr:DNA polymerase IV [Acetatifactor aquisgranensis]